MLCYHGKHTENHSNTWSKEHVTPQSLLTKHCEQTEMCPNLPILHTQGTCLLAVLSTYRITQNAIAVWMHDIESQATKNNLISNMFWSCVFLPKVLD